MIEEYIYLRRILAKKPSSSEIDDSRSLGVIQYSHNVYSYHFGDGNFQTAIDNLERIVAEREASDRVQEEVLQRERARQRIQQEVEEIAHFKAERRIQEPRQLQFEG